MTVAYTTIRGMTTDLDSGAPLGATSRQLLTDDEHGVPRRRKQMP